MRRWVYTIIFALAATPLIIWAGWWLHRALRAYRFERLMDFVGPSYVSIDMAPYFDAAMDWRTPLRHAAVPLGLLMLLERPRFRGQFEVLVS